MRGSGIWLIPGIALLAVALTAVLVKVAPARGWVVIPQQNRWNKRVVAQFGGAAILLAFLPAAVAISAAQREYLFLLVAMAAISLLGLIDDIKGLGPKPKLIVEFLLAGLVVYGGIVCPFSASKIVNEVVTAIAIVSVTNAFNLIDNMDGLAGGVAVISLAASTALMGTSSRMGMLALMLMLSVAGFLVFNLNPARIFMGDLGSLPIGFFLACAAAAAAGHSSSSGPVLLVPFLLLLVPIFDIFLVVTLRWANGRAAAEGARDHASHRLVLLGLGERSAVAVLQVIALLGGSLVLLWSKFRASWTLATIAVFLIGVLYFWLYLARLEVPEGWLSRVFAPAAPELLRRHAARVMSLFLNAALCCLGIYIVGSVGAGRNIAFGPVTFLGAISATAKIGVLWMSRGYDGTIKEAFGEEAQRVLKAALLTIVIMAPCWMIAGVPAALAALLAAEDAFITGVLLFLGRTSGTSFDRLFHRHLILVPYSRGGSVAPQIGNPAPAEFRLPPLAGSKELADEVEL